MPKDSVEKMVLCSGIITEEQRMTTEGQGFPLIQKFLESGCSFLRVTWLEILFWNIYLKETAFGKMSGAGE